ncbi:hypothetical protein ACE6H2_000285 [Prunus campanulata]
MQQYTECNRSLFTRSNVPCRVGYVSPPAMAISFPKNKDWDYFKGIPMSAVTSRQGFQGGRALACRFTERLEPVKVFKGLICPNYKVHPILTDGSANNKQVNLNELRWNTLFLFFSNLNISTRHISSLNSVHDEVKNRRGMHKIVWIPVVEHWNEKVQKDFERLRAKMPWYTAQCFSPILDLKEKWRYKGKPILVVMNPQGDVKNTNAFPLIWKDGMKAFPFYDAQ